jgi:hypothetical protein
MSGVMAATAGLSDLSSPNLVIFDFSTGGSGTVTIPAAATDLTVEAWGGGAGGGQGLDGRGAGGGGGAGGYCKSVLVLGGGDPGKTISYSVGPAGTGSNNTDPGNAGGLSTVSSGTYLITALQATGGFGGMSDGSGNQGVGGIATGGDTTNTPGAGGATATLPGATATTGDGGLVAGAGGDGGLPTLAGERGNTGTPGRVRFVFTV